MQAAPNFASFFSKNESILHPNSKAPNKAVLVGINYDAWPMYKLKGCHADAANAEDFLLKIGTKKENIRVITDKANRLAPTKAIILEAFEWLKAGAKDGDVLYLHFSGHGVEMDPPADNPQNRASSKAICPIDLFHTDVDEIAGEWEFNDMPFVNPIMGEDFERIFGHLEHTKVNLTVVYDCCHSTGALRALGAGGPVEPKKTAVRGINVPETMQVAKVVTEKAEAVTRGAMDKEYEQRYSIAEQSPPYVIGFAAAQGWEFAIDARTANGPCGAFSHFFYALLKRDAKEVNSQGIIESVTDSLRKNGYTQTPSLTTTRKTVPFFADLTKDLAGSEKLSFIKLIHADKLFDEKLLIQFANKTKEFFRKLFHLKDPDAVDKDGEAGRDLPGGRPRKKKTGKDKDREREGKGGKAGLEPKTDDEEDPYIRFKDRKKEAKSSGDEAAAKISTLDKKKLKKLEKQEEDANNHFNQLIDVYDDLVTNADLKRLRVQDKVLFDGLLKPAVDFSYQVASTALAFKDYRDVGKHTSVLQHLPTAINFVEQLKVFLELEGNDTILGKVFETCMPIILNTAQQLVELGKNSPNGILPSDEGCLGLFDLVIGKLPLILSTDMFNLMSSRRDLAYVNDELMEILEKCPPAILQVAHSLAAQKKASQSTFLFNPQKAHNDFFDSLLNVTNIMLNDPQVREKEKIALRAGMKIATRTILHDPLYDARSPLSVKDEAEERARRYLGSISQSIIHTAIKSLQRAKAPPTKVETTDDFALAHRSFGGPLDKLTEQEIHVLQSAASLVQNIIDPANIELRKKIFFNSTITPESNPAAGTVGTELQLYTPGAIASIGRANMFYGKYDSESIYGVLSNMYVSQKKKKPATTKSKTGTKKVVKIKPAALQPAIPQPAKPDTPQGKCPLLAYYL